MRIAQVSPLYESVPPLLYGGTERIVAYLCDSLMEMGHDVTLFASGDSTTTARLVPCCQRALRLDDRCVDPLAHHLLMLEQVARMATDFDIIHFHVDYLHFPLTRRLRVPNVTTLHGRLDIPDLVPLYREFPEMPVVSISDAQRRPLPWLNWQATVHHGVPAGLLPYNSRGGDCLAFVGRISPEKGLDTAIAVARRTGVLLKVAAKIDKANRDYYESVIRPLLDTPLVEYVGEIGENEKRDFLGNARALIFPINWEEPFGLVLIEAMACGTPVIAYGRGSVPEVVKDGVSGLVVNDVDGAVEAVHRIPLLSRRSCRDYFDRHFVSGRMAAEYVEVYRSILGRDSDRKIKLVNRVDAEEGRCVTSSR